MEKRKKKTSSIKLDETAYKRCGFGIRQLLAMKDEEIIQAKENAEKRIKAERERSKKEGMETGVSYAVRKELRLHEVDRFHHLIVDAARIDRLHTVPIKIRAIVNFAGNVQDLEAMGIEVHSHIHNIFTITATKEELADLATKPATCRINLPRKFRWELHVAVPQAEIDQIHAVGNMGQGTIVGLLDSTLDVKHHAFRNMAAPHGTRVMYMWVQEPVQTAGGVDPPGETPQDYSLSHPGAPNFAGLNYGRIYDASAINTAIGMADTYGSGVNQIATIIPDQTSMDGQHGTHTTGIAAGSGLNNSWNPGIDIGSAPLADIVFIAFDGDEDHAIDALNFIFEVARHHNQPTVINLSFGSGRGPHDGTSDFDTAVDNMLFTFNGRSVVCAAGNDNDGQAFRKGTISAGATEPSWNLNPAYTPSNIILTIWYTGPELDYRVGCGGADTGWKTAGQQYRSHDSSGNVWDGAVNGYEIYIYRDLEPRPNLRSILVWIPQASDIDDWTIEIRNPAVTLDVNYWAWLDSGIWGDLTGFTRDEMTITDIACGQGVLTVGACDRPAGASPEMIWSGSGCGPTRNGRIKPEITTVGDISSAESGSAGDYVRFFTATSMSAPVVTGAIALLLEINPTLNQDAIKGLLTQTTDTTGLDIDPGNPATYDPIERNQYGFGRLRMLAPFQHSFPLVDVDVWIRTADDDYGNTPYLGDCFCHAPEVWVYDSSDNETTTLNWKQDHRVRVRVHNLGDTPAFGTTIKLFYTRPWTAPDAWEDSPCQDSSNIAIMETVDIPALGYIDVEFTQRWRPEEGEVPSGGTDWGDHYCLLVVLDNTDDPLGYEASSAGGQDAWNRNIKGTNNVALRNLTIQ